MRNGDFPDPVPSDRLGRMLLISMVFHVVLFGGLAWFNARAPKTKPLVPTYTVDLVNIALPAPGPKTEQAPESPPPGPVAKPGVEVREKSGPLVKPSLEPKKAEARKSTDERKPVAQLKPVASPPPAKTAPAQPPKVAAPPPKIAAKPAPEPPKREESPKPAPAVPRPAEPAIAPGPGLKPVAAPKKPVTPKTMAETKTPAEKVKKPDPEVKAHPSRVTEGQSRERQIAQEINAAQQKAAESSRNQKIQDSIQDLEKGLAAKSRNQAYKEAVGQAAARLSAGKVSAKVPRGGGGSGSGGGSMGSAQTAAYGAQVSQTVRRHWQPNCLQRSNMHHLKAVIIVRIQPDGSISASWFEKESGDRLFDQSAMTAVTSSNPLPALPPGQEKLEIGITFTPEWKASS